ncbi:zinc finger CCCH domain-containing protein 7B-like, partial [Acipenser ruthenus]|uniref:zinc finger CCCH domain-containing protein 7B-like n=1 Tax=Acipenser ruthenus TaxID=7906 RepID=UPI0027425B6C
MDRRKRREEIQKALRFIQSSLPFPQPQEYEVFLSQLVSNLFEEGNALYSESQFKLAVSQYSEAVGVNQYAQSEALPLPPEILEHLYVNRAAAHFRMGLYEKAVLDCDQALQLNEGSARALYRKTRALSELERDREAYECSTHCLLTAPH